MTAAGGAGFRLLRLATSPAATSVPSATAPAATIAPAAPVAAPAPLSPAAVAQLLVPVGSPLFAGHFPGRPLLPGIAHLALLRHVLGELAARGELPGNLAASTAIAEVRKLRLRRPISPGDRIELRLLSIAAGGVIRFELRRQPRAGKLEEGEGPAEQARPHADRWQPNEPGQPGELASEGTVRVGACGPPPAGALVPTRDALPPAGLPAAAVLLPHAPPARLLVAVLAAGTGGIVGTGGIPADHPLAAAGEAPGFLAIELAAQAAAALEALARQPGWPEPAGFLPRLGYLVGVRGAHLPATLPTGIALRVTAVPAGGAGALSTYEAEVAVQDAGASRLAAATISTFLPDA
jgi:predicted hotdog family 3-hydroxylacyl-ACP dehydratase